MENGSDGEECQLNEQLRRRSHAQLGVQVAGDALGEIGEDRGEDRQLGELRRPCDDGSKPSVTRDDRGRLLAPDDPEQRVEPGPLPASAGAAAAHFPGVGHGPGDPVLDASHGQDAGFTTGRAEDGHGEGGQGATVGGRVGPGP